MSRWRTLAGHFPCTAALVTQGKLPQNYEPRDVIKLYAAGPVSSDERRVLLFLLHVWNRYDYPFELSEAMTWDPSHLKAFLGWISGRILGGPFLYC